MVQLASLVAAGIGPTQARLFQEPLGNAFARFGIDTPVRQAAFVAQCAHESRDFTALEESLFYRTPERICAIFRSSVPNVGVARPLACNPKLLANHVYAKRLGNGDTASGDGWRYRGRGLIQLTGRSNYARAAAALGRPYVEQPDLVAEPADSCLTAAWFWHEGKMNALADASRIDAITRAINGPAMAGAQERRELFLRALAAFQPATRGRISLPTLVPEPPERAVAPAEAAGAPQRSVRGGVDAPSASMPVLAWTVRGTVAFEADGGGLESAAERAAVQPASSVGLAQTDTLQKRTGKRDTARMAPPGEGADPSRADRSSAAPSRAPSSAARTGGAAPRVESSAADSRKAPPSPAPAGAPAATPRPGVQGAGTSSARPRSAAAVAAPEAQVRSTSARASRPRPEARTKPVAASGKGPLASAAPQAAKRLSLRKKTMQSLEPSTSVTGPQAGAQRNRAAADPLPAVPPAAGMHAQTKRRTRA